jgi:hypothetical protein
MAKKKGKVNEQARIQQEQARYRKMYIDKLQYYCDTYGGKGTFTQIPLKYVDGLYKCRMHPLKIVPAPGCTIDRQTHKYIHKLLFSVLHSMKIVIGNGLPDITLDEFIVFGQALTLIQSFNEDANKLWAKELGKRLAIFSNEDFITTIEDKKFHLMTNVGCMLSDMQVQIIVLTYNLTVTESGGDNIVYLDAVKPTVKYFKLPEGSRPAHRVTWPIKYKGIKEFSITSSVWDPSSTFANLPIAVYIQSHALQRLLERIDVYSANQAQINLVISLMNPVIIRTEKNTGLIEYTINGNKYGYLVCEFIDGDILIKTFLFLTNNGTPEGKKLNELTGLGKYDKKYLAIDRISSFIASDIEHNETLKKLFIQSGCESLVYAAEHLNFEKEKFSQYESSSLIAEYIKKEPVPILEEEFVCFS